MSKFKVRGAVIAVATLVLGFVGYNLVQGDSTYATDAADCSANAIVNCGVLTPDQLKAKYAANEHGLQAIFSHYGITAEDIADSANAKSGVVTPDQEIIVDGEVIATNAMGVGRTTLSGPNKVDVGGGTSVYEGPRNFNTTQAVYVFYNDDGSFRVAIMKVCGNPVPATAVPVVEPVYSCTSLKAQKISRNEYQFTTTAVAKDGATIKGYTYKFGDSSTMTGGATIKHTYQKAGTYTANAIVQVDVDGETVDTTEDCKVSVTVKPELAQACEIKTGVVSSVDKEKIDNIMFTNDLAKCTKVKYCDTTTKTFVTVLPSEKKSTYTTDFEKCNVSVCDTTTKTTVSITNEALKADTAGRYTEDQTKCAPVQVLELPHTGVMDILGGGLGAGALSLAGYYYVISRKML